MADAYIGEIRIFPGKFAPSGWAFCNGQLMQISQNSALFAILGTQYGGDGKTTFALPNLMGNAPMHQGAGAGLTPRKVGETVGDSTAKLDLTQIPAHTHIPQAINATGNDQSPTGHIWSQAPGSSFPPTPPKLYNSTPDVQMSPLALAPTGGSQKHNNMQPFIAQNFIICLKGEFPSHG
ncbi:phage tail protein [Tumebacillus algifaecis]|uniref:Phage tail protein n=1 Tax=Tumebacillus algifaecis TaxID=1214604 RepID=A0A223CWU1_9BACL|nr:tail fiber protein [Tumebacillus algifaecis]ASS73705.1 phage tail protein [Tumebacillus algifaecis]